jgi:hypothetical protein
MSPFQRLNSGHLYLAVLYSRISYSQVISISASVYSAISSRKRQSDNNQGGRAATNSFYERSSVRIRYEEIGSGFPLLVTPGGKLAAEPSLFGGELKRSLQKWRPPFREIRHDNDQPRHRCGAW